MKGVYPALSYVSVKKLICSVNGEAMRTTGRDYALVFPMLYYGKNVNNRMVFLPSKKLSTFLNQTGKALSGKTLLRYLTHLKGCDHGLLRT